MGDVTPAPLQGPSSKEKRYDRQLRLWAANGQAALEDAHVLLVNCGRGTVGVEALKNLVLPGIGNFTIVDSNTVTEPDLGVNFFLDQQSLGQSRAKRCCELLRELNPDVHGSWIHGDIVKFVQDPTFLQPYTLVVLTAPTPVPALEKISEYTQREQIPLVYVHCVGFYSQFSLSLPSSFPIVETHPDPESTTDLRLLDPWQDLTTLADKGTNQLDSMSDHDHGHVPYLLLLLHYLELWKTIHGGSGPQNYKEKTEFREMVRKGARTHNAEGGEENFDEAVAAVLKSLNPPAVTSAVREVLEAEECKHLTKESANFWYIASAIADFQRRHSVLPLPGSIPDMKAQSDDYIRLQQCYKAKARQDVSEVVAMVRMRERDLGKERTVDESEIEAFCKGAGFVKLMRGRPLHFAAGKEKFQWVDRAKFAYQELHDPESMLPIHIAFLVYDVFIHEATDQIGDNPFPGSDRSLIEPDAQAMLETAGPLIDALWEENGKHIDAEMESDEDLKALLPRIVKCMREIIRAGGGELHNISALTGGMVAQEIIKVITKQYMPVDNTCVFDGITSKTAIFRL